MHRQLLAVLFGALCLGAPAAVLAQESAPVAGTAVASTPSLRGRFLHITDPHPDSHYEAYSSTKQNAACHRGSGSAGFYGAETSSCDSPFSLINETFKWIDENLKDSVDFVVWTGDSARHDSDEEIPRTADEILDLNRYMVQKVMEVFGKGGDSNKTGADSSPAVPIIPTFGNNDISPHNILAAGPNFWTKNFADIWKAFIPEEQRHSFERGGWFYVEAIPNHLAVFSLNTMYFYEKNAAVDGCDDPSEPGYLQMDWLRVQLQFLRERGMKAILTGHVPPVRTRSKQSWDETCWQKYTLWLKQYRDVVAGATFGHMNLDHFLLQDTEQIRLRTLDNSTAVLEDGNGTTSNDLVARSTADYLTEMRKGWSELPSPPLSSEEGDEIDDTDPSSADGTIDLEKKKKKKKKKTKKEKYLDKIGGPWAERYTIGHVGPSIIPNYFPSIRVFEYNITGLDQPQGGELAVVKAPADYGNILGVHDDDQSETSVLRRHKKKKKKHPKSKFPMPDPPSKSAPPGPAYSPQSLTLLGYTQYFANLSLINQDTAAPAGAPSAGSRFSFQDERWHEGKNGGSPVQSSRPKPEKFTYEVEYDTLHDDVYHLKDLTVLSYLDHARRIGADDVSNSLSNSPATAEKNTSDPADSSHVPSSRSAVSGHVARSDRPRCNKVWYTFLKRAFVSSMEDGDLEDEYGNGVAC